MNWLDYVFLAIFIVSVVAGITRGFARVVIGLAATILGVLFAARFYGEAGAFLHGYVGSPSIANGAGFLLILIGFLLGGAILGKVLATIFKWAGVGWLDRLLGGAFGALRAVLICIAIVMIGMAFPRRTLPDAIIASRYAPYFVEMSRVLTAVTPQELKDAFARNYEEVKKVWTETVEKIPTKPSGDRP